MENGLQPINPTMMQKVGSGENDYVPAKPSHPKEYNTPMAGLTKREHFASLAMQGMCSMENKGDFTSLDESFSMMAKFSDTLRRRSSFRT